jgi:pSer/pThr/pTyr-binding forkhead associated (FHA) protein
VRDGIFCLTAARVALHIRERPVSHPELPMSTQPHSSSDSLDRTDVLPVLDVEAYEASLTENQKGLSRTDTWTVEALRDIDDLIESASHEGPVEIRSINANGKESSNEALTLNVDRILKRIADLEADIVAAHEANAVLQKRNEAVQLDRDQQLSRAEALVAENARLVEHRALADEMAQRFERQLRDESQRHGAQLKELQATLQAERTRAEERQKELADSHAKSLTIVERTLSNEKASAAELARRFAAKLSEYDKLTSVIDQHTKTVDDLLLVRDDLQRQLERETAATAKVKAQLAATKQASSEHDAVLRKRDEVLAEKDAQRAQLETQLSELRASLAATEQRVTDAQRELAAAAAGRTEEERRRVEMEVQLRDAQGKLAAVSVEHEAAQAQIRNLCVERDALLPAASDLETRTNELQQSAREITQLREQLAAARAEVQAQAQLVDQRAAEIAAMQAKSGEYEAAIHELEQAGQAREEAAESGRLQLQTVHDECAIMADQRDKARARAKHLTQEIFRRDHVIAELEADLAVHSEALAAIRRDVSRIGEKPEPEVSLENERVLEPIEHSGETILLTGSMLTVGRTNENDICLPSKLVSRHHARLLIGPTGIIVEDAGSTNGCFVNGEQIRQHLMHDGDVLELGDLRYRLRTRTPHGTSVRANVVPLFDQEPARSDREA